MEKRDKGHENIKVWRPSPSSPRLSGRGVGPKQVDTTPTLTGKGCGPNRPEEEAPSLTGKGVGPLSSGRSTPVRRASPAPKRMFTSPSKLPLNVNSVRSPPPLHPSGRSTPPRVTPAVTQTTPAPRASLGVLQTNRIADSTQRLTTPQGTPRGMPSTVEQHRNNVDTPSPMPHQSASRGGPSPIEQIRNRSTTSLASTYQIPVSRPVRLEDTYPPPSECSQAIVYVDQNRGDQSRPTRIPSKGSSSYSAGSSDDNETVRGHHRAAPPQIPESHLDH
eukprot:gene22774-1367_t